MARPSWRERRAARREQAAGVTPASEATLEQPSPDPIDAGAQPVGPAEAPPAHPARAPPVEPARAGPAEAAEVAPAEVEVAPAESAEVAPAEPESEPVTPPAAWSLGSK